MAEGKYLDGAWIDTDAPMYLIRHTGVGENVVRNGDLVAGILDGSITPAHGPLWLPAHKVAALTAAHIKTLKQRGVTEVVAITLDQPSIVAPTHSAEG